MQPRREGFLQIIFVILVFLAVFYFNGEIRALKEWGYYGVFLISLISSATILLPAPGWAVVIAMSTVLNPYLVGLYAGVGSGIGEITGYMAGHGIVRILKKNNIDLKKYKDAIRKYDVLAVFVLAAIPNPIFDIAGIAAGSVGIPWPRFLVACVAGRVLRYVLLAYLGSFSISLL